MNDLSCSMTKTEAQRLCDRIRQKAIDLRDSIAELRDKRGWIALGYETWDECCKKELRYSKQYVDRILKNHTVRQAISCEHPESETIVSALNDGQVHELSKAPEESRVEILQAASEAAEADGRHVTAKDIREAREAAEVIQDDEVDEREPEPETTPAKPHKETNPAWDAIAEEAEELAQDVGNHARIADFLDGIAGEVNENAAVAFARLSNIATKMRRS